MYNLHKLNSNQEKSMVKKKIQHDGALVNIEDLPNDIKTLLNKEWVSRRESDVLMMYASSLFNEVYLERVLEAAFMGEEQMMRTFVKRDPKCLLKPGTFRMPLLNQDGTKSEYSEYIIHGTPLEVSLYTGNFWVWNAFFPLIPSDMLEEVLETMQRMSPSLGRSDIIKIDWDPRPFLDGKEHLIHKLKYHQERMDAQGKSTVYEVLCNPDALVCYFDGAQQLLFYVNQQTNEIRQVVPSAKAILENKIALESFLDFINFKLAMNSGARTDSEQYELIDRLFDIKLERNGIYYEIWDKHKNKMMHYQDTSYGGIPLMNAYRKFLEILEAHVQGTSYNAVNEAWSDFVGMAQRYTMPYFNYRLFDEDSCRLDKGKLKASKLSRNDEYINWEHKNPNQGSLFNNVSDRFDHIYPHQRNSGPGYSVGLYYGLDVGAAGTKFGGKRKKNSEQALAAVCLSVETSNECFDEQLHQIERKLNSSFGCDRARV